MKILEKQWLETILVIKLFDKALFIQGRKCTNFLILEKEKSIMDKTTLIYFTIIQFCRKIKNMIKDKTYHQKYRVVHV